MKRCAQTPAYKAFEQEQYAQYLSSPAFQDQLRGLRQIQDILKQLETTGAALATRPDALGSTSDQSSDPANTELSKSLQNLKLPTCYENPLTFYLLLQYSQSIDAARKRLGLPLKYPVNLATLPGEDINAYTYPVVDGTERVVAINTQLFMFAYQMTKVTVPSIALAKVGDKVAVTVSSAEPSTETLSNFSLSILEFLNETPPSTSAIDRSYDALLITLTEGVETFVVAHEYGHAILGHQSVTAALRLGAASDVGRPQSTIPILARSWRQELEADDLGFRLLADSLRSDQQGGVPERRAYVLSGALFFFRLLSIIEDARHVRDSGQRLIPPTEDERRFLRSFVAGTASSTAKKQYAAILVADHPPAWLRAEQIDRLIALELKAHPITDVQTDYLQIGQALEKRRPYLGARSHQVTSRADSDPCNEGELATSIEATQVVRFTFRPYRTGTDAMVDSHRHGSTKITKIDVQSCKNGWLAPHLPSFAV